MQHNFPQLGKIAFFCSLALVFSLSTVSAQSINDNVAPPLNTSESPQAKRGNLEVLGLRSHFIVATNQENFGVSNLLQTYAAVSSGGDSLGAARLITNDSVAAKNYCDENGLNCFRASSVFNLINNGTDGSVGNNYTNWLKISANAGDSTYGVTLPPSNGKGTLWVQDKIYAQQLCLRTSDTSSTYTCLTKDDIDRIKNPSGNNGGNITTIFCTKSKGSYMRCGGVECKERGMTFVGSVKSVSHCNLNVSPNSFCTISPMNGSNGSHVGLSYQGGSWYAGVSVDETTAAEIHCVEL